jgi:hypothetical protein
VGEYCRKHRLPVDDDNTTVEMDIFPEQRTQLAPAHAGEHCGHQHRLK